MELGAFSIEKARAYLTGRGQFCHWALTAETVDAIIAAVEWPIPFYLNLVFEQLRVVAGETRSLPTPELVELALQRLMKHGRTHFDHWDERLSKMLDDRTAHYCQLLLAMACHRAEGIAISTIDLRLSQEVSEDRLRSELLGQLLDLLTSDGYLVRHEDAVRFRSALLRRYWREVQP